MPGAQQSCALSCTLSCAAACAPWCYAGGGIPSVLMGVSYSYTWAVIEHDLGWP